MRKRIMDEKKVDGNFQNKELFDLSDFIPYYPPLNKDFTTPMYGESLNPYQIISSKREFSELGYRKDEYFTRPTKQGIQLKHQKLVKEMITHLDIDGMLFFHALGTGKTCAAVAITEAFKGKRKILILTRGEGLKNNFIREIAFTCTDAAVYRQYRDTGDETFRKVKFAVGQVYNVGTYETFSKLISTFSDEEIVANYSNIVVVIDEVHNLRIQAERKETQHIYDSIHRFLHLIKEKKVILLSATPLKDSVDELASIMNLILPIEKQLPNGKIFLNHFIPNGRLVNEEELSTKLYGRISFLSSIATDVKVTHVGEVIGKMVKFHVASVEMSKQQSKAYEKAVNEDVKISSSVETEEIEEDVELDERGGGLYSHARQATLFVDEKGRYGRELYETLIVEKGNKISLNFRLKGATDEEKLKSLELYSTKYAKVIREIISNPTEKVFIYGRYIRGGGLILFSKLLELFGFVQAGRQVTEKSPRERRYFLITSKTPKEESESVRLTYNNKANNKAALIQVIIGSPTITEGFSFFCVRQVHILTPHWNNTDTEQAIGRSIRVFSHNELPPEERTVRVFRHCSIPESGVSSSVDYLMYHRSETKDLKIKQVEKLMKSAAIDCSIMKERNEVSKCLFTNGKKLSPILDTYNLMVTNEMMENVEKAVKSLFQRRSLYSFEEILHLLGKESQPFFVPHCTSIILIRVLNRLINRNVPILNRNGFFSFLRERMDQFFVVPKVNDPNEFFLFYYTLRPMIHDDITFDDVVEIYRNRIVSESIVKEFKETHSLDERIAFIDALDDQMKERFIEAALVAKRGNIAESKKMYEKILEKYKQFIEKLNGLQISTLIEHKRCLTGSSEYWHDCTEEEIELYENQLKQKQIALVEKGYGVKGIESGNVFRLFELSEQKVGSVDRRKLSRGRTCPTYRKTELIRIVLENELNLQINGEMKSKNDCIKAIREIGSSHGYEDLISTIEAISGNLTSLDAKTLNMIHFILYSSKSRICRSLKAALKEKGLLEFR